MRKTRTAACAAAIAASLAACATPVDRNAPIELNGEYAAMVTVLNAREVGFTTIWAVDLDNAVVLPERALVGQGLRLLSPVAPTTSATGLPIAQGERVYDAVFLRLDTSAPPGQYAVTRRHNGSVHSETNPLFVDCFSNRAPVIELQPGKLSVLEPVDELMQRLEAMEKGGPIPPGSAAALQDVQTALKDYPAVDPAAAQLAPIVGVVDLQEAVINANGGLANQGDRVCDEFETVIPDVTTF